jgi:hypothetical protein
MMTPNFNTERLIALLDYSMEIKNIEWEKYSFRNPAGFYRIQHNNYSKLMAIKLLRQLYGLILIKIPYLPSSHPKIISNL